MLRPVLRRFRGMIALYAALGISAAAAGTATAILLPMLIDRLTNIASGASGILSLLFLYGAMALAEYLLNYFDEFPRNRLIDGMYQFIRRMALEKVSRIEYTAYQDIGTGRLVQVVENGASAGRDILFSFYLRVFVELLPGALFSVAAMGVFDWRVMLGALSGYVVVFLVTKLLLNKLRGIKEEALISQEWLSKAYVRAFMEMVVFRVNRRFAQELRRAEQEGKKITSSATRLRMVHELFFCAFAILVLLIKIVMIFFSIRTILAGEMTVGVLLALITLTDRIYQPIAVFNVIYVDYRLDKVAWKRMDDFLQAPDDEGLLGGQEPRLSKGEIRFEGVSFTYGDREILSGVDLTIRGGRTTALLGKSGAGKSTLISLALGLLKPTKGRVLIDGQDLSKLELNGVYGEVAYLSQDAAVFDGTVRENISPDEDASEEELWEALAKARLDVLIRKRAEGLDTQIGEHGIKLSGGEKQRLALARVFYRRPKIVILDEPTSAMDRETEREVVVGLRESLPGRTVVIIAHDEGAIAYAQETVVLSGGKACAMQGG